MIANIDDRASIERIYPAETFAYDSGTNSDPKATVRRGVRIVSGADSQGAFKLERAARQVAELGGPDDATFLSPEHIAGGGGSVDAGASYDAASESGGVPGPTKAREYDAFVDLIIASARSLCRRASPGPGDDRLRGLRQ